MLTNAELTAYLSETTTAVEKTTGGENLTLKVFHGSNNFTNNIN